MALATKGLIHTSPYTWVYADAAARTAATGFAADDVGGWAVQLDNGTVWELTDDSPITWGQRGGGGAATPTGPAGGVLSGTYPNPGFAADMATQAELDAHTGDTTAAHAASAIAFIPNGSIAATDVQAAIQEVRDEAAGAGFPASPDRVHARKTAANQAIGAGTWTIVTWPDADLYDTNNLHYTSGANLTGTVAKTNGGATLTGTGTLFTSELSVGQVIDVPGTATERKVVTAIASDTSLTVAGTFANTASGQTAARVNSAIVIRAAGTYRFTARVAWLGTAATTKLARFRHNAATNYDYDERNATFNPSNRIAIPLPCAQWDFVEVEAFTYTSGDSVLGFTANAFTAEYIGP